MVEESGSPQETRKQEGAQGKMHSAKIQPWQPASFNWAPPLYMFASLQKHSPNVTPSTDCLIDEGRAPLWSGHLQDPALNMTSFRAYRLAYRLMSWDIMEVFSQWRLPPLR